MRQQLTGAGKALGRRGVRHQIPGVVGEVALLAQGIEHDDRRLRKPYRQRQRLNRRLVMAGFAGQRSVAVAFNATMASCRMAL